MRPKNMWNWLKKRSNKKKRRQTLDIKQKNEKIKVIICSG